MGENAKAKLAAALAAREATCWAMASVFLDQKDAHGLQDIGVEIQAIQHTRRELQSLAA